MKFKARLSIGMESLTLVLLACGVLSLADGTCVYKAQKEGITHCQDDDDKTWHAVGSTWRNKHCMDCTCSACCSHFNIPTRYPEDCISVFDMENCEYIVYKRDDPSVLCPIYAGVLK